MTRILPELWDTNYWAAATEGRRQKIVDALLSRLPGFERGYLRAYPDPTDASASAYPIATLRHIGSGILFNLIPGGTAALGFSARQIAALRAVQSLEADMAAQHGQTYTGDDSISGSSRRADLAPFLLARFPVTVEQVTYFLGPDHEIWDMETLEVAAFCNALEDGNVSEEDVNLFLRTSGYQLPSEAQWEYACRAGSDTLFWWGDTAPLEPYPNNCRWAQDIDNEAEVARFTNRFGLVNMAAYPEICADLWHEDWRGGPEDGTPWTEAPDAPNRVVRGGGAVCWPWQLYGEWELLLSSLRFNTGISSIGIACRPLIPLTSILQAE